jgi:hypothetical protein
MNFLVDVQLCCMRTAEWHRGPSRCDCDTGSLALPPFWNGHGWHQPPDAQAQIRTVASNSFLDYIFLLRNSFLSSSLPQVVAAQTHSALPVARPKNGRGRGSFEHGFPVVLLQRLPPPVLQLQAQGERVCRRAAARFGIRNQQDDQRWSPLPAPQMRQGGGGANGAKSRGRNSANCGCEGLQLGVGWADGRLAEGAEAAGARCCGSPSPVLADDDAAARRRRGHEGASQVLGSRCRLLRQIRVLRSEIRESKLLLRL